ncbi:MAG: class I SAM-dependent methyltransferase [Proteobacteria bacterium]|nr:class I SAM-dependent methyltransferase [Pseudomonadota bacterium]
MTPSSQPQSMQPFCKACHAELDHGKSLGQKNGFELLRCPCGTVTVDPFPTLEELDRFYQSYKGSKVYRPKAKKKIRRALRRVRRLKTYTKGRRFLDVGCNCGFTVKAALDLGLDAYGIDLDRDAVQISREAYGEKNFEALSIQDYAARGKKADILYTSEVIEHVPDPPSFVKAAADILEPGGILYLTTPDAGHWSLPRDFAAWRAVTPPSHIVYFTRQSLTRLLQKHGFRVKKVFFSFKPGLRLIAQKA